MSARPLLFAALVLTAVACEPRYQEAQQPPPGQLPPGQPPPPGYYAGQPAAPQPGMQPGAPASTAPAATVAPTSSSAVPAPSGSPAPTTSATASSTATAPVPATTAPAPTTSPTMAPPPKPAPSGELPPAGAGKRTEGQVCSVHKDCESGMCEGEGCGFNAGKCVRKDRMCTRDLVMYCGCNGQPFSASGSCPGRVYKNKGPCK